MSNGEKNKDWILIEVRARGRRRRILLEDSAQIGQLLADDGSLGVVLRGVLAEPGDLAQTGADLVGTNAEFSASTLLRTRAELQILLQTIEQTVPKELSEDVEGEDRRILANAPADLRNVIALIDRVINGAGG